MNTFFKNKAFSTKKDDVLKKITCNFDATACIIVFIIKSWNHVLFYNACVMHSNTTCHKRVIYQHSIPIVNLNSNRTCYDNSHDAFRLFIVPGLILGLFDRPHWLSPPCQVMVVMCNLNCTVQHSAMDRTKIVNH